VHSDAIIPSEKLRLLLRGFPEAALQACARFEATGSPDAFDEAVCRILQHHLDPAPATDLGQMPGTTRIRDDLGLDSLTVIEMVFLFEDLFSAKVPQEELMKIVTLDDLRALLKARLPARS
jgi:acyl carrier protein